MSIEQQVTCDNCDRTFPVAGIAKGSSSAEVCPGCRKVVIVEGEIDPGALEQAGGDEPSIAWKTRPDRTPRPRPAGTPRAEATWTLSKKPAARLPMGRLVMAVALLAAGVALMYQRTAGPAADVKETRRQLTETHRLLAKIAFASDPQTGETIGVVHDDDLASYEDDPLLCDQASLLGLGLPSMPLQLQTPSGQVVRDCPGKTPEL